MIPKALTVAGSDSSAGSGIQADLKTFSALGVYGATALTAITAQSTADVREVVPLSPETVWRQIESVVTDIGCDGIKTGMLVNADIVRVVARAVQYFRLPNLVVDPVMLSTSGAQLLNEAGIDWLRRELLPLASVVTPNIPEAERLVGFPVRDLAGMERAARELVRMGCRSALVKGGHLDGGREVADVFFDGEKVQVLRSARIGAREVRGTGCTLSAAIVAGLAKGWPIQKAVLEARTFLLEAMHRAEKIGRGPAILKHFFG
jgi:hydroxymethylpyrimidine/phosphomethylpyrimidine kinase